MVKGPHIYLYFNKLCDLHSSKLLLILFFFHYNSSYLDLSFFSQNLLASIESLIQASQFPLCDLNLLSIVSLVQTPNDNSLVDNPGYPKHITLRNDLPKLLSHLKSFLDFHIQSNCHQISNHLKFQNYYLQQIQTLLCVSFFSSFYLFSFCLFFSSCPSSSFFSYVTFYVRIKIPSYETLNHQSLQKQKTSLNATKLWNEIFKKI